MQRERPVDFLFLDDHTYMYVYMYLLYYVSRSFWDSYFALYIGLRSYRLLLLLLSVLIVVSVMGVDPFWPFYRSVVMRRREC